MNLRGGVIGVAIFILTIFVTVYGISVFYPMPQYDEFCQPIKTAEIVDSPERCTEINGYWTSFESPVQEGVSGYCDRDYYCRQDYENASEDISKKRFFVSIPLGIVIIALGALAFSLESVGVGLMAGGVATFVYGAGNYWGYASDLWRFVISLFGLVFLILFAYWFEKRRKGGSLKKLFSRKKKRK